jgi:hypothetical protein
MIHSGGDINSTGYSDPQVDQLIDQARTETDEQTGSACSTAHRSSSRITQGSLDVPRVLLLKSHSSAIGRQPVEAICTIFETLNRPKRPLDHE